MELHPKDVLHRWCSKYKVDRPKYKCTSEGPEQDKRIKCELQIGSFPYVAVAYAIQKKYAERNAAENFIKYLFLQGHMKADNVPSSIRLKGKEVEDKATCSHDGSGGRPGNGQSDSSNKAKSNVCQLQNDKGLIREASSFTSSVMASKRKHRSQTNDGPSSSSPPKKTIRLQTALEGSSQHGSHKKKQRNKKPAKSITRDPYAHLTESERRFVIHCVAPFSKEIVKDPKSSGSQLLSQQKKCPKSSEIPLKSNRKTSKEKRKVSEVVSQQSSATLTTSASSHGNPSTQSIDLISNNSSGSGDSVIFVKQTFPRKTSQCNFSTSSTSILSSPNCGNQTVIENPPQNTLSNLLTSTPVTSSSSSRNVCLFPTLTPIGSLSSSSFSNKDRIAPGKDLEPIFSYSHGSKGSESRAPVTSFCLNNQNKTIFNISSSESPSFIFSSSPNVRFSWPSAIQGVSEHSSLSNTLTGSKNGEKSFNNDSVIVIDSTNDSESIDVIEILDSDTEDMDVDDDNVIQSLLSIREQTINLDAKDAGSLSETVTTITVPKVCSPKKFKQLVLVMDTNILIHSLSFFAHLLSVQLSDYGRPLVLLPWMVILELDQLKIDRPARNNMDPALAYRARKATRLLQKVLMDHHPRLVSQKPTEVYEQLDIPIHSNDDRILHCCLQWKKRHENDEVVLVTRDRNLSTKALMADLKTSSNTNLWTTLKIPTPAIFLEDRPGSSVCTPEKTVNYGNTEGQPHHEKLQTSNKQQTQEVNQNQPPHCNPPPKSQGENPKPTSQPQNVNFHNQPSRSQSQPKSKKGKASKFQPQPPQQQNRMCGISQRTALFQDPCTRQESEKHVHAKLSSIWDLSLNARHELFGSIVQGLNDFQLHEACGFLNHLQELLGYLGNSLDECLNLSPVILRSNEAIGPFTRLQELLNSYHNRMGPSVIDPVANVSCEELIVYFEDVDNRLRLAKGLEELREMFTSINNFRATVI